MNVNLVDLKLWSLDVIAVSLLCGRSSGVERNLAKVEVVGSNPIARSIFFIVVNQLKLLRRELAQPRTAVERWF